MIEPKILKGFRDSLPKQEIVRRTLLNKIESIFRSYGFVPIDTPVLEFSEVLLGKGGGETDKQMFRFQDNGGRDVAMRFDLTVPLARFVAANINEISFPFKRYHMAKVWRGEKPQKGRYREFLQCDFDIVGADNASSDFEILSIIHSCLTQMEVGPFTVKVSHRGLLNKVLQKLGIEDKNASVLRAIDKLDKIGKEEVSALLGQEGITPEQIETILSFTNSYTCSFEEAVAQQTQFFGPCPETERLEDLAKLMKECKISDSFRLDTSITRGLDYYTGIVYETTLDAFPQIGSICSGGRYNNLANLYTKEKLPGVGSCIGLDRLMAALEELNSPVISNSKSADVLVVYSPSQKLWSASVSSKLRALGLKADSYCGDKGLGQQFAYAEKNRIPFAVSPTQSGLFSLKKICTREVFDNLTFEEVIHFLQETESK